MASPLAPAASTTVTETGPASTLLVRPRGIEATSRRRLPRVRAGRARLTLLAFRRRAGFLAFGGVFFLLGSFFAIAPWGMLVRDTRIEREGTRTTAVVSEREVREDSEGDDKYIVHYAFLLPDGARAEDQTMVGRSAFEAVAEGDLLRVVYDPAQPTDGYPIDNGNGLDGGMRTIGGAALFSAFGALFAAFGGLFLWGLLVRLPSTWARLLAEGLSAEGAVARVEVYEENASQARLHYTFPDRFGTAREGTTEWGPRRTVDAWTVGDVGLVRYDRRDAETSVWLGRGDLTFYR